MNLLKGPTARLAQVVGFALAAGAVLLYLLSGTHITVPLLNDPGHYTVVADMDDVDNLAVAGQVRIAGVRVGEVRSIDHEGEHARVVLSLEEQYTPLHEGATIRLGARSLVEEGYLEIVDGEGEEIAAGTTLPAEAVRPSVQLNDVLRGLDSETRDAMSSMLRSMGTGTKGTRAGLRSTLKGLGHLGREGHTALDAIAAQSEDLTALAKDTATLLSALDTGEGQIATMVANAEAVTKSTSGQREAIENTMRQLPGVLASAGNASEELAKLSGSLAPVAAHLKSAAPFLSAALRELPETSKDLRGMLPELSQVLDRAPATLDRIPTLGSDLRRLIPAATATLQDVNPMLAYLKPYGPEIAAYFANFAASMQYTDEVGQRYIRLMPLYNDQSLQSAIDPGALGAYLNPIPAPGAGGKPGPFTGEYPRVEREQPR